MPNLPDDAVVEAVEDLSAVQAAVVLACAAHMADSFLPISSEAWWRAQAPFAGRRAAFGAHLRALEHAGVLARLPGRLGAYAFTSHGEQVAIALSA